MKQQLSVVFKYIRSFYHTGIRVGYLLSVMLLLTFLLWYNYEVAAFRQLIKDPSWLQSFALSYGLFAIPFAAAFALQYFFYPNTSYLRNKKLLLLIMIAPAIFALRVNFNFHHFLLKNITDKYSIIFWKHCSDWIIRAALVLICIYFITKVVNPQASYSPTGLNNKRSYFLMAACLVPFISLAALQPSFQQMYPRVQLVEQLPAPHHWWQYLVFEACYAFDFLSIEAFFRGFLLFAFMRICGMNCIVPAACFYCCIHFGKPLGEAISSFWGGLLLGIVSYHTKNIWGGVIVHICIAAFMELAGLLVHVF